MILETIEANKRMIHSIAEELFSMDVKDYASPLVQEVLDYLKRCNEEDQDMFMQGVTLIGILHLVNLDLLRVSESN